MNAAQGVGLREPADELKRHPALHARPRQRQRAPRTKQAIRVLCTATHLELMQDLGEACRTGGSAPNSTREIHARQYVRRGCASPPRASLAQTQAEAGRSRYLRGLPSRAGSRAAKELFSCRSGSRAHFRGPLGSSPAAWSAVAWRLAPAAYAGGRFRWPALPWRWRSGRSPTALEPPPPRLPTRSFSPRSNVWACWPAVTFWLLFANAFVRRPPFTGRRILLLLTGPALLLPFVLTNWLGLTWTHVSLLVTHASGNQGEYVLGPMMWAFMAYCYGSTALGISWLLKASRGAAKTYRRHVLMLVFTALLPLMINVIDVAGKSPFQQDVDLAPFALRAGGSLLGLEPVPATACLDLVPLAATRCWRPCPTPCSSLMSVAG